MADSIKVYRTAAFAPLAHEIKRFGAMTKREALERFDSSLIDGAMRRRVCAERDTKIGKILYLLHQGRKLTGMAGSFIPNDDSLMNAVCLRTVGLMLEARGLVIDLLARRRSLVYHEGGKTILVLAQQGGYAFAALRRMYKALIDTGEFDEIHMYSYLSASELEDLAQILYAPARGSRPLDRERLRLFTLPPPEGEAQAAASHEGG